MSDSDIKNSENVLIQENITENTETPKVIDLESFEFNEVKKWDDFDLPSSILRGIYSHGFENPSPIQMKGILPIMKGRDVIAQSQSGTGKTATFVIGALSRIDLNEKMVQALVLVPTRELACQIEQVFEGIGMGLENLKTHVLVGGRSIDESVKSLKYDHPQVVIGCIGRTCDMLKRRALNLSSLRLLIIDEADEMLSYGFREDVYHILDSIPIKRQVVVFSATMSTDIIDRLEEITTKAIHITVKKEALTLEGISQYYIALENDQHKYETLKDIYSSVSMSHCIIYCNSVNRVKDLTDSMKNDGFPVCCIHSDMEKRLREESINNFRGGGSRVLISSDVTARGIDIQQVSIVINFDVCNSVHTYLHRIGRSGRWGRKGIGINFITRRDVDKLRKIEQHYSTQINELPGNFMTTLA